MISTNKRIRSATVVVVALGLLAAACGSDDDTDATTATTSASPVATSPGAETTGAPTDETANGTSTGADTDDVTTEGISDERCATNEAVGTLTYLSGFDFAATPSIVDVVLAEQKGYFDAMCLDVDLKPSSATFNYPLVASGEAHFASAASYTEIVNYSVNGAVFVALVDYGKVPVEALITKEGGATTLAELEGKTIGVKSDIPASLVAMLAQAGLARGTDYEEVTLDGYDPIVHLGLPIDALPVYKSNEPGQLDAAGIKYNIFDPAVEGIPGTFGLLYTSADFAADNPTVVEDFIRAALKGMEDAIADPDAAVAASIAEMTASGSQSFLTEAGESYRLEQELKLVLEGTPDGAPVGLIDPGVFDHEYHAYVEAGVWPEGAPEDGHYYDADVAASLYGDDGKVIWPAS